MKLFDNFTPQELRDAIEIELQNTDDVRTATNLAIGKLNMLKKKNPGKIFMMKAKDTSKLIKKAIINKLGKKQTVYVRMKEDENIKVKMGAGYGQNWRAYKEIGFSNRYGEIEPTIDIALEKCKKIENIIKNQSKENSIILDSNGNTIVNKKGIYDEVIFSPIEYEKIRHAEIATHNHPEEKSLSSDDIFFALSLGIKEIRCTVPSGKVYSFKISMKQKPRSYQELEKNNFIFFESYKEYDVRAIELFMEEINEHKKTKHVANLIRPTVVLQLIINDEELNSIFNMEYNVYE